MSRRFGLMLGVAFVVIGSVYWWLQSYGLNTIDLQGTILLIVLGIAMAFALTVLIRGSRDL